MPAHPDVSRAATSTWRAPEAHWARIDVLLVSSLQVPRLPSGTVEGEYDLGLGIGTMRLLPDAEPPSYETRDPMEALLKQLPSSRQHKDYSHRKCNLNEHR